MEKKTLSGLFSQKQFVIPDYQRGYAWELQQWNDFFDDLVALTDDLVKNHYCGTVVTFEPHSSDEIKYSKTDRLKMANVVDGQQRLTTCCLFLAIVIKKLIKLGENEYESKIPEFLHSGTNSRLVLNNETNDLFLDLIKRGHTNSRVDSTHQKRLLDAYEHLENRLEKKLIDEELDESKFLTSLYDAMTRKLVFTFYTIEEECEIGMTFELMNSRGKDLAVLELLKNYFMHWVARNEKEEFERLQKTGIINRSWKETYSNLGRSNGNEDQCLRVAWILHCSHTPKNWNGYDGFKEPQHIPLRDFSQKTKQETGEFLCRFAESLSEISKHYSVINKPTETNTFFNEEFKWLSKIRNTGNVANFLPLIVAARIKLEQNQCNRSEYLELLKSIECYSSRVFLFEGKRSNAGKSKMYLYGWALFNDDQYSVGAVPNWIYDLVLHYSPQESFFSLLKQPGVWCHTRKLRYVLFEYELFLLENEGKGKDPVLKWSDLSDSTVEHILPQTPKSDSQWLKDWVASCIHEFLHDIGNLVLTQNNSNYLNFEFSRKRGSPGVSPSYANSDIRQERHIARFDEWTPKSCQERRDEITAWIKDRWSVPKTATEDFGDVEIDEDEDLDITELDEATI